ncbi:hypothetical protein CB1_000607027 [Camelus ferus]|nr:hypothetical protein CB1_000607027 [Camelus ferus]
MVSVHMCWVHSRGNKHLLNGPADETQHQEASGINGGRASAGGPNAPEMEMEQKIIEMSAQAPHQLTQRTARPSVVRAVLTQPQHAHLAQVVETIQSNVMSHFRYHMKKVHEDMMSL